MRVVSLLYEVDDGDNCVWYWLTVRIWMQRHVTRGVPYRS
jgi:hypothetical protein